MTDGGVQVSGENEQQEVVVEQTQTPEPAPAPAPVQEPEAKPEQKQQRKPRKPKFEEPKVGRIVLYVTATETIRPAIVSAVRDDSVVDLTVFNSEGASPATEVRPDADDLMPHTWHWPTDN